jgi:hypothetical protein
VFASHLANNLCHSRSLENISNCHKRTQEGHRLAGKQTLMVFAPERPEPGLTRCYCRWPQGVGADQLLDCRTLAKQFGLTTSWETLNTFSRRSIESQRLKHLKRSKRRIVPEHTPRISHFVNIYMHARIDQTITLGVFKKAWKPTESWCRAAPRL